MIKVTKQDISAALRAAGLKAGDVVIAHSDTTKIGLVDGCRTREEFVAVIYEAYVDVLGPEGTLGVPTFTYAYARHKTPFVYEESPSELDIFSEYVRKRPGAVRSLHPLFSFAAVGRHKHDLCEGPTRSAFGLHSPYDRLCRLKGKMLFYGCNVGTAMTFIHHVEHVVGVSYSYHKAFFTPVFKGGREVEGPFTAYLRHLGPVEYHHKHVEPKLKAAGIVAEAPLGMGAVQAVDAGNVLDACASYIYEEPCFFIKTPYYVTD